MLQSGASSLTNDLWLSADTSCRGYLIKTTDKFHFLHVASRLFSLQQYIKTSVWIDLSSQLHIIFSPIFFRSVFSIFASQEGVSTAAVHTVGIACSILWWEKYIANLKKNLANIWRKWLKQCIAASLQIAPYSRLSQQHVPHGSSYTFSYQN